MIQHFIERFERLLGTALRQIDPRQQLPGFFQLIDRVRCAEHVERAAAFRQRAVVLTEFYSRVADSQIGICHSLLVVQLLAEPARFGEFFDGVGKLAHRYQNPRPEEFVDGQAEGRAPPRIPVDRLLRQGQRLRVVFHGAQHRRQHDSGH